MYGNIKPSDAYDTLQSVTDALWAEDLLRPLPPVALAASNRTRVHHAHALIPSTANVAVSMPLANPGEANSAMLLSFPVGLQDFCEHGYTARRALATLPPTPTMGCLDRAAQWAVLSNMLYQPTFDVLRTRQQLGYVVQAFGHRDYTRVWEEDKEAVGESGLISDDLLVISILIQGTALPCQGMLNRTLAFLHEWNSVLKNTEESVIESTAEALASMKEAPYQSPGDVFNAMYAELANGRQLWNRRSVEATALRGVSRSSLLALFEELVVAAHRRVVLCLQGTTDPGLHPPLPDPFGGKWLNTTSLHYLLSEENGVAVTVY